MKKSEITNGMLFELKTGSIYYVIEGMIYIKTIEHTLVPCETLDKFLETYEDDLTSKKSSVLDIVKVFDNGGKMIWGMDQVDWSKIPVDTKVLVSNSKNGEWDKRYFAKFENGKVFTFTIGATSWSTSRPNNPIVVSWKYAKLANDKKLEILDEQKKENITFNNLNNEYQTFCDNIACLNCDYTSYNNECRFAWLLDNYNITHK